MTKETQPAGFSLIEVIFAMLILSVAFLAMGASTGHVMAQIQASELRTERVGALRQAAETLRGTAWASLESVCAATNHSFDTDNYDVQCTVQLWTEDLKRVDLVTVGPGFRNGRFTATVTDSFAISIANPVQ